MVSKLRPGVVAEKWEEIWRTLEPAYSRFTKEEREKFKRYVMNAAVSGVIQLWVTLDEEEKPQLLTATKIVGEEALEERSLLVYGIALAGSNMSEELWKETEDVIVKYAKEQGCVRLAAFTNNTLAFKRALSLGWKMDSVYITKEI